MAALLANVSSASNVEDVPPAKSLPYKSCTVFAKSGFEDPPSDDAIPNLTTSRSSVSVNVVPSQTFALTV